MKHGLGIPGRHGASGFPGRFAFVDRASTTELNEEVGSDGTREAVVPGRAPPSEQS
jgi:hypothetical protein